jgi:diguanylate cyclase (GGDEF)-like protein/PAS domain S-box-containing protein
MTNANRTDAFVNDAANDTSGFDASDPAVYRTLLESTRAIPWSIDWASMRFTYMGPQIEALLGWPRDSWKTVQDWSDRMHAEDRERTVNFCVSQSQAGVDHEADYKALTQEGGFVWIRDVVHVIRNEDGSPKTLVGFMFDISERKRIEEKVMQLHRELRELSNKDGLTGVANRRMFDTTLNEAWEEAIKTGEPLSLVMFDIDCFKQYNDRYGHLHGDECLRRVGRILETIATRPRDFFARYGGEEFVMLLPNTNQAGAEVIAERCRDAIEKAALPHEGSSVGANVTVSLGVGTVIPTPRTSLQGFLEAVDAELYRSKQNGRNRISATILKKISQAPEADTA